MRLLVGCLLLLVILSCNSETSKNKEQIQKKTTPVITKDIKTDSIKPKKNEFPFLDETNAMDFFLTYEKENKEQFVRITTNFGIIDIELFNETKFHRANFIYLTKRGAFDNTQFHRVVKNFIIQGGNTDDIEVAKKRRKIGHYLLPTDTKRGFKHHRGVISMPSSDIENPHKLASPYEFFIVQKDSYHLDGSYTIFGKVTKGMDVVDKINSVRTDKAEWPLHNVYIEKVEIIE
jgi:peptidyl-prolyl cis-trans isomerase A (cyclophilin A)